MKILKFFTISVEGIDVEIIYTHKNKNLFSLSAQNIQFSFSIRIKSNILFINLLKEETNKPIRFGIINDCNNYIDFNGFNIDV